jgi:hypothetical protein
MARKPTTPKIVGRPLPADWRSSWSGWKVWAMLAKIPERDYEAEAMAFQQAALGRLSEDWSIEWRSHCRRRLVERGLAAGRFNDPPDGLGLFA